MERVNDIWITGPEHFTKPNAGCADVAFCTADLGISIEERASEQ